MPMVRRNILRKKKRESRTIMSTINRDIWREHAVIGSTMTTRGEILSTIKKTTKLVAVVIEANVVGG